MDSKLAEAYGTAPVNEVDLEALATAELATKLAAADEIDVDGMSDERAEELAAELLGGSEEGGEEPPTEEPAVEEAPVEEEKTAGDATTPEQEKIAEADYLGRVMAHAYVNERNEIEKAAAAAKPKTASDKTTVVKTAGKKDKAGDKGKVMAALKAKKASAEVPAEVPAEEQVSALDRLAQIRAAEILKENGIDPSAEPETEKKSSINEEEAALLHAKVEERAQALLVSQGYEFKTNEEAPTEEK